MQWLCESHFHSLAALVVWISHVGWSSLYHFCSLFGFVVPPSSVLQELVQRHDTLYRDIICVQEIAYLGYCNAGVLINDTGWTGLQTSYLAVALGFCTALQCVMQFWLICPREPLTAAASLQSGQGEWLFSLIRFITILYYFYSSPCLHISTCHDGAAL